MGVCATNWKRNALDAQAEEREVRESALEKERKVDKRQSLEHLKKLVNVGGSGGLFSHHDFIGERNIDCPKGAELLIFVWTSVIWISIKAIFNTTMTTILSMNRSTEMLIFLFSCNS